MTDAAVPAVAAPLVDTSALAAAATAALADWSPLAKAAGEPKHAYRTELWTSADGRQSAGVWSAPRGRRTAAPMMRGFARLAPARRPMP